MIAAMAAPLSRRRALVLLGLGAATGLSACTETTAPPAPTGPSGTAPATTADDRTTPTAVEVPDTEVLQSALSRTREVLALTRAVRGAEGGLATLLTEAVAAHREQAEVLERVLTAGGAAVPRSAADDATVTTRPSPGGDDTEATPAPGDDMGATAAPGDAGAATVDPEAERARLAREVADLAARLDEDASPAALRTLAGVSGANLPMLLALTAQRLALADLLAERAPSPDLPGPRGRPAAALLPAYRAATYGLEVLAARASGEERAALSEALRWVRGSTDDLTVLAGAEAGPAPLGYGLDGPTGTEQERADLASQLLAALPAAVAVTAGDLSGDADGVHGCVLLAAGAVAHGRAWGLPFRGFPGMRVP